MQAELPAHIEKELTLPDGKKVWLVTLNALHRDEAREMADFQAAKVVLPWRKGGEFYTTLLAELDDQLNEQEQAAYLAQTEYIYGDLRFQIADQHPDPERPERGEKDDDAYDAAIEAWEKAKKKAQERRDKAEESKLKELEKEALALTSKVRLERCAKAYVRRKRRDKFGSLFLHEALWRAVRKVEDTTERFYSSAAAIALLDDVTRNALMEGYFGLDSVRPEEIPTSPGAS